MVQWLFNDKNNYAQIRTITTLEIKMCFIILYKQSIDWWNDTKGGTYFFVQKSKNKVHYDVLSLLHIYLFMLVNYDTEPQVWCDQGRIQDFKLGWAHLKKLRRVEGGAKNFGVFRVTNHYFTPKNQIFSNFRGARAGCAPPPPPWIHPWLWPNSWTHSYVRHVLINIQYI